MLGPMPWCSMAVTRVRAHGFMFNSNSAACTGVGAALGVFGLAWGLSTSCCPVQPCVGSIAHLLDCLTPLSAFQPCVWCFVIALGWLHMLELVQGSW